MTIEQFLAWVLNAGGSAMILSFILEYIPKFQGLKAETKKMVFFAGTFLISVGAYLVLTYVPVETLNAIAPYFNIAYVTFIAQSGGNWYHGMFKTIKDLESLE